MYVTNLRNTKVGINGLINLKPSEVNRYIDNEDLDLVARVLQLKAAGLVSVVDAPGLVKTTSGRVIRTLGVDKGAIGLSPRTQVKVENVVKEVKAVQDPVPVVKEEVKVEPVKEAPEVEEVPSEEEKEDTKAKRKKKKA